MQGYGGSEWGFEHGKSEYVEEESFLLCFDDISYDS